MSDLALISERVAQILPTAGTDDFAAGVVAMLRDQVDIDEACMIVYPRDASPQIAHRETAGPADEPNLDTFINGPFLLDPYYVAAAREGRFGFFPLAHLAPTGFKTSEYYRIYYRFSGIFDECGYLTPTGDGGFANLSLARANGNRAFESSTLPADEKGLGMEMPRTFEGPSASEASAHTTAESMPPDRPTTALENPHLPM